MLWYFLPSPKACPLTGRHPRLCVQRVDFQYNIHISYMEIYCEQGYDLIRDDENAMEQDELPRVTRMEDAEGNLHLVNLSAHLAQSEADALNLLFLGDVNRSIRFQLLLPFVCHGPHGGLCCPISSPGEYPPPTQ